MTITISPTQDDIFKTLGTFLIQILPDGTEVIQAQANRTPEPKVDNFVVMTPLRMPRLSTNVDDYLDGVFTGSIAGSTLTITAVTRGILKVGSIILGDDVADSTQITAFLGGSGGLGTYTVTNNQTVMSETLYAGETSFLEPAEAVIQLDVHGPLGSDNAQKISTLLRDPYGVDAFAILNPAISPLYTDDSRQMPFTNEQQQYEWRWIVEAHLQVNQTVTAFGQQFADTATIDLIDVDAVYPP